MRGKESGREECSEVILFFMAICWTCSLLFGSCCALGNAMVSQPFDRFIFGAFAVVGKSSRSICHDNKDFIITHSFAHVEGSEF
ncbi:hypothetical protein F2P79_005265 [Pimephales promelas]|nr:hypothetical protein F2P79_005265 [Pimephales promelas]